MVDNSKMFKKTKRKFSETAAGESKKDQGENQELKKKKYNFNKPIDKKQKENSGDGVTARKTFRKKTDGNKYVKNEKGDVAKKTFKKKPFNNKDGKKETNYNKSPKKDFKGPKKDFGERGKSYRGPKIDSKGPRKEYKGKKPFLKPGARFEGKKGPGNNQPLEKPNWMEMKANKKELRTERRKSKITAEVYELSTKAKMLSARIARKILKDADRIAMCQELHGLLKKGQYVALALAHDLTRVIQVLLKHGDENIRCEIADELMPMMSQMIQSKYGHHSVKSILKNGTAPTRSKVIESLYGNIVSLSAHVVSAPILDYAYTEFATPSQKICMQQEFYGDIYKNSKDASLTKISDTYKESPEMKGAILSSTKANIQRVLDKNRHDSELLHDVLYDYICECSADDRAELVTTISPLIVPISNSVSGVSAACICVWQGTNKDKKSILKVVKEHVVALSLHKSGYRLLLAIFDSVDDTVLVKKALISTLLKSVKELAKDHWGRMTVHWLVTPGDTAYFHPSVVKCLKDGRVEGNSKKEEKVRVKELHELVLPALCEEINKEPEFWLSDASVALLTVSILTTATPDQSQEAVDSITRLICKSDWKVKDGNKLKNGIEDAGLHLCLNKLAQHDKDCGDGYTFGKSLLRSLDEETVKYFISSNRGCYLLLKAIESNKDAVRKGLIETINPHAALLKKGKTAGSKLLVKILSQDK